MNTSTVQKPYIRRVSLTHLVKTPVIDYRDGERFQRPAVIEIRAEEWLNKSTGRYRRMYSAREAGALGSQLANNPRAAILRACHPVHKSGQWLTDACTVARQLDLDVSGS